MANKGIDYVLSLNATRFQAGLSALASKTKAAGEAVDSYWKKTEFGAQRAGGAFVSMQTKIAGAIAAIGGIYVVKSVFDSVTTAATEADKASFNLGTSIQAANREFKVGDSRAWAEDIKKLSGELKIYSTVALEQAAAKTIDMTKRLGLSEQQMVKVIRAAANLSAGKFELSDGVERLTAALRGEAEASEALGLTLSETYVKGWYEARGATQGAWKDLNDVQKAQVRFNVMLAQSDPLLGKAAKSAGTYGGVLTMLSGNVDAVKAALGETITRNKFVIEGIGKVSEIVKGLGKDIDGNRAKWMEWSKQGILSVLDFSVAGIRAASSLYSAFAGISGGVKETLAYYYELKAAFLDGAASGAKWKDALGITSGEAKRLADESATAASKSEALQASAARSFAEMETGAPKVQAAAAALQKFRDEVDKVAAKEINPAGDVANKAEVEFKKVGDKWIAVAKDISKEKIKPQVEIESEAYEKSLGLLQKAVEAQAKNAEQVNIKAASGASGSWADAADTFESSWSRAIDAISNRLSRLKSQGGASESYRQGGLIGAYNLGGLIQGLAAGGGVRNIQRGGHLPGYGGGDRRLLLGEDGEVMINKSAVRAAGLRAALAFNAGRWDIVLAELSKRVHERIGFNLGGMLGNLPLQALAAGGSVNGSGSSGIMTIIHNFGPGRSVPVQATTADAARLKKEFARMHRMRSA